MPAPSITQITFLNSGGSNSWGTSFTPTVGTHAAGDLIIIIGALESSLDSLTNGSGWTSIGSAATIPTVFAYSKIATSSSETIPTFNAPSFQRYEWCTFVIPDGEFDATTPTEGFQGTDSSGSNPVAPSTTPSETADFTWVVAASHGDGGSFGNTWSYPATFTGLGQDDQDFLSMAAAYKTHSSGSATGTATFTFAPSNNYAAFSFLIRPAAGGDIQVSVDVATANASANNVTVAAQRNINISVDVATANISANDVTVVAEDNINVAVDVATLTASANDVTIFSGKIVQVDVATVNASANDVAISTVFNNTISVDVATSTASMPDVAVVIPIDINISVDVADATIHANTVSVTIHTLDGPKHFNGSLFAGKPTYYRLNGEWKRRSWNVRIGGDWKNLDGNKQLDVFGAAAATASVNPVSVRTNNGIKIGITNTGRLTASANNVSVAGYTGPATGPGSGGPLKHGVHTYNWIGFVDQFETLTGREVDMTMQYMDPAFGVPTMFTDSGEGFMNWLQADSSRLLVMGINHLTQNPGQFLDTTLDSHLTNIANYIDSVGLEDQVIWRLCYEMNGWWMPWHDSTGGAAFKAMWNRVVPKVKNILPNAKFSWCPILSSTNTGEIGYQWNYYPSNELVDIIAFDQYDAWFSGSFEQRWDQMEALLNHHLPIMQSKGKEIAVEEYGVWSTGNSQGGGDNPVYITNFLNYAADNNFSYMMYFNIPEGDVDTTLGENPNALAAYQAFWATH